MKALRTWLLAVTLVGLVAFAIGCAVTDYPGIPSHKTQAGARFWGSEVAFSGFGANDGTYSYGAGYDSTKPGYSVRIDSLRNPVFGAFSRDGIVDRDLEDTKGKRGSLTLVPATPAGRFGEGFIAVDPTPGVPCEFFSNITQNHTGGPPLLALCFSSFNEEVDSDQDLQASFGGIDDVLNKIWSGTLQGSFTAQITSININGTEIGLVQPASIGASTAPWRPTAITFTNSAGVKEILNDILLNTTSGAGNRISFTLDGGARISLPASMSVAFDHNAIRNVLANN